MPDSNIQSRIIGAMADDPENTFTAKSLAVRLKHSRDDVQKALHILDDNGAVILRNGFYRLSEASKGKLT